jgi:hypothetical protein
MKSERRPAGRRALKRLGPWVLASLAGAAAPGCTAPPSPSAPPCADGAAPPGFPPDCTRACDLEGVSIASSDAVPPEARLAVAHTLRTMVAGRHDLLPALAQAGTRVDVLGDIEETTDLSTWSFLATDEASRDYWNGRTRGFGATLESPSALVPEEDALCYPTRDLGVGSIVVHELAHTLHLVAMAAIDPGFGGRVDAAYKAAMAAGLWADTYAATNSHEYFAQGLTAWFDAGCEASPPNGVCNDVNVRAELLAYDPTLAELAREVAGDAPPVGPCTATAAPPTPPRCAAADDAAAPAAVQLDFGRGTTTVRGELTLPEVPPPGTDLVFAVRNFTDVSDPSFVGPQAVPAPPVRRLDYVLTGLPSDDYILLAFLDRDRDQAPARPDEWVGSPGGLHARGTRLVFTDMLRFEGGAYCGLNIDLQTPPQ